jgi:hypothetical protein
MSQVSNFVLNKLKGQIQSKYVIPADTFFRLIDDMGLRHENEILFEIFNYLEETNIDINFGVDDFEKYREYKYLINQHKLYNDLRMKKTYINQLTNWEYDGFGKIDDSFLNEFRKIEEE